MNDGLCQPAAQSTRNPKAQGPTCTLRTWLWGFPTRLRPPATSRWSSLTATTAPKLVVPTEAGVATGVTLSCFGHPAPTPPLASENSRSRNQPSREPATWQTSTCIIRLHTSFNRSDYSQRPREQIPDLRSSGCSAFAPRSLARSQTRPCPA